MPKNEYLRFKPMPKTMLDLITDVHELTGAGLEPSSILFGHTTIVEKHDPAALSKELTKLMSYSYDLPFGTDAVYLHVEDEGQFYVIEILAVHGTSKEAIAELRKSKKSLSTK